MHLDRRFLGWGAFFIAAGAVPLAVRAGYMSAADVGQVWRLWPLILVGIGVAILLSRTATGWIGGLVVAATFGLLIGAALAGGFDRVGCGFDAGRGPISGPATDLQGDLADGSAVTLDFDCGALSVGTSGGTQWSLQYRGDAVPVVDQAAGRLHVSSPEGGFFPRGSNWDVTVPTGRNLSISVAANAGSSELRLAGAQISQLTGTFNAGSFVIDLSGARVGGLDVRLNAGAGTLTLPSSSLSGRLNVNAGSLALCAAPEIGLRITTTGALASTDFSGSGLVLSGTTWESPNYASAPSQIQLSIDANAASVSLNRGGTCR